MNAGPEAVRPEDGGEAGRHGGGAAGVGLRRWRTRRNA